MVAAIEMHLDQRSTRRIRVLWDLLEELGVQPLRTPDDGKHRPHVSLIGARALNPDRVAEALKDIEVAAERRLNFQFAGVFVGRVLFLGLAPTPDLMRHQADVWRRLQDN